jgi:hypothetical protein
MYPTFALVDQNVSAGQDRLLGGASPAAASRLDERDELAELGRCGLQDVGRRDPGRRTRRRTPPDACLCVSPGNGASGLRDR